MNETEELTQFWTADRGAWSAQWVDHYWHSDKNMQRDVVIKMLSKLQRWRSVLEIGAHCGPNLRRIAKAWDDVECVGLDVNPDAVRMGNAGMRAEGLGHRVQLIEGAFPEVTKGWEGAQHDVLLTCFMLAYLAPADLVPAIRELQRLSARFVVCIEPHGKGGRQISGDHSYYTHNYDEAFKASEQGRWWRYELQPAIDGLNSVAVWARIAKD